MGYFSNGTEGAMYEEQYCLKCVHMDETYGCPCLTAHAIWNYDECNNKNSILHKMIPRGEGGQNEQCAFYVAKKDHGLEADIDRKNKLLKEALEQLLACEWEVSQSIIVKIEKELEEGVDE